LPRIPEFRTQNLFAERTLALASVETISGRVVPQAGKDPRTAELLEVAEYSSA
jgi:hypothetical protein